MDDQALDKLFEVHTPKNIRQMERKAEIRIGARDLARLIARLTPNSAERTIAIRKVQEAMLIGIEAIGCNE